MIDILLFCSFAFAASVTLARQSVRSPEQREFIFVAIGLWFAFIAIALAGKI